MDRVKSFNQALNLFMNGRRVIIKLIDDAGVIKELKTPLIKDILSVYFARLINHNKTSDIVNIQYFV
jgi:hypothetical protein